MNAEVVKLRLKELVEQAGSRNEKLRDMYFDAALQGTMRFSTVLEKFEAMSQGSDSAVYAALEAAMTQPTDDAILEEVKSGDVILFRFELVGRKLASPVPFLELSRSQAATESGINALWSKHGDAGLDELLLKVVSNRSKDAKARYDHDEALQHVRPAIVFEVALVFRRQDYNRPRVCSDESAALHASRPLDDRRAKI